MIYEENMRNIANDDLFGKKKYRIGNVVVRIPTLAMICGSDSEEESRENKFWQEAGLFLRTPTDMISELDSLGLDFELISDYTLFMMMFIILKSSGYKNCMLFDNFDLFELEEKDNCLVDKAGNIVINEDNYTEISDLICRIVGHKKTEKIKFGNSFAKRMKIQLDYEHKERERKKNNKASSVLGSMKLRVVCSGKTPYSFESINNVTIYELLWTIKQIDKEKSVDELKQTALVGNDLTKIASDKLSPYAL